MGVSAASRVPADGGRRPALLHEWLQRPHVRRWWAERETYEDVVAHYLPAIEGTIRPTTTSSLLDGRPIGMIQTYLVADYPDTRS